MNSLCEVCDSNKAATYCKDCTTTHLYCETCFEISHKSDRKKAHAKEPIASSDIPKEDKSLICPTHPKEVLKYACLDCGVLICGDCMAIGEHKGHMGGTPQNAIKVWSEKFKEDIKDNELQSIKEGIEKASKNIQKRLDDMYILKKSIEVDSQQIVEIVLHKTQEVTESLNKKINKLEEKKREILDMEEKIPTIVEECKGILNKETISDKNCSVFLTQSMSLKNLKAKVAVWGLPSIIQPEPYESDLNKLLVEATKITSKKREVQKSESGFMESDILENLDQENLLTKWIKEEIQGSFKVKLLYKGTPNKFNLDNFFPNSTTLLTIIQTADEYLFGEFTYNHWTKDTKPFNRSGFVYSLTREIKGKKVLMSKNDVKEYDVQFNSDTFSAISEVKKKEFGRLKSVNKDCIDELMPYPGLDEFFAGSLDFAVKEVEIYEVQKLK